MPKPKKICECGLPKSEHYTVSVMLTKKVPANGCEKFREAKPPIPTEKGGLPQNEPSKRV